MTKRWDQNKNKVFVAEKKIWTRKMNVMEITQI